MIVDITGIILIPGNQGKDCPGNGTNLKNACCNECDYLLCCVDETYPECCKECTDKNCPRKDTPVM